MKSAIVFFLLVFTSLSVFGQVDSLLNNEVQLNIKLKFLSGKEKLYNYDVYTDTMIDSSWVFKKLIPINEVVKINIPVNDIIDSVYYDFSFYLKDPNDPDDKKDEVKYIGMVFMFGQEIKGYPSTDTIEVILHVNTDMKGCSPIFMYNNNIKMNLKIGNDQTFRREDIIQLNRR